MMDIWERFDRYREAEIRKMLESFTAAPAKPAVLKVEDLVAAIEKLEKRERRLPPEFN